MPIYEYRCEDCGVSFDKFVRSMSSSFEVECPECHSKRCRKGISLFGTTNSSSAVSASAASCAPSS